jgi:protein-S-isoprenylcysteine O-methyltransferase Ste14
MLRAITDNTFLSQVVRIQSDRGQRVVSTGVYGFVRHPMYLGASLLFVGSALDGRLRRGPGRRRRHDLLCLWSASSAKSASSSAASKGTQPIAKRSATG